MTSTSNVKVSIRIRPLSPDERIENNTETISIFDPVMDGTQQLVIGKKHSFTFDHVYSPESYQSEIYQNDVIPLVDSFLQGYNVTVFAYGQTGSGKTFTMGTGSEEGNRCEERGLIPRAIEDMFSKLHKLYPSQQLTHSMTSLLIDNPSISESHFQFYASFWEIYNEEVKDLLSSNYGDSSNRTNLVIREDSAGEIYLAGSVEEKVGSPEDLFEILRRGTLCRATASTDMNLTSSRSHAIFTLILKQAKDQQMISSRFHFVDLAGSERLKRTNAIGNRAKEAISINSGLLALGNVISALGDSSRSKAHVPYRDSKLTRVLQNSLGGNSQTLMIACVSPAELDLVESVNTLKYANRARNIKNLISINEGCSNKDLELAQLKKLVMDLRQQLILVKDGSGIPLKSSQSLDKNVQSMLIEHADIKLQLEALKAKLSPPFNPNHLLNLPEIQSFKADLSRLFSGPMPNNEGLVQLLPDDEGLKREKSLIRDALLAINQCLADISLNDDDSALGLKQTITSSIESIQTQLLNREDILGKFDKFKHDYSYMKQKYEEKLKFLQDMNSHLKKDKDVHSRSMTPSFQIAKVSRDKYEEKIKRLTKDLNIMKEKYEEISKLSRSKSSTSSAYHEQIISSLKATIQSQKLEKQKIIQHMTEEMSKLRLSNEHKEAQIKELKLNEKAAVEDMKKYKKSYEFQRSLHAKKATEPIVLLGSSKKPILSKHKKRKSSVSESSPTNETLRELMIEPDSPTRDLCKSASLSSLSIHDDTNIVEFKLILDQEISHLLNVYKDKIDHYQVADKDRLNTLEEARRVLYAKRSQLASKFADSIDSTHSYESDEADILGLNTLQKQIDHLDLEIKETSKPFHEDFDDADIKFIHDSLFKKIDCLHSKNLSELVKIYITEKINVGRLTQDIFTTDIENVSVTSFKKKYYEAMENLKLLRQSNVESTFRYQKEKAALIQLVESLKQPKGGLNGAFTLDSEPTSPLTPTRKNAFILSRNDIQGTPTSVKKGISFSLSESDSVVKSIQRSLMCQLSTPQSSSLIDPSNSRSIDRIDPLSSDHQPSTSRSIDFTFGETGSSSPLHGSAYKTFVTRTSLTGHTSAVLSLACHDYHSKIYSCAQDGLVREWDYQTTSDPSTISSSGALFQMNGGLKAMIIHDDQLVGASMNSIKLWDLKSHKQIRSLNGHNDEIQCLYKHPTQPFILFSGGNDNCVLVWDLRKESSLATLSTSHRGTVFCMTSSPDYSTLITGSRDHSIRIFDISSYEIKSTCHPPHYDVVHGLATVGQYLVSGSRDYCLKKWKSETTFSKLTLDQSLPNAHSDWIKCLVSISSNQMVSASRDGQVKLWRVNEEPLKLEATLKTHDFGINCMIWKNGLLFTGSNDRQIKVSQPIS